MTSKHTPGPWKIHQHRAVVREMRNGWVNDYGIFPTAMAARRAILSRARDIERTNPSVDGVVITFEWVTSTQIGAEIALLLARIEGEG